MRWVGRIASLLGVLCLVTLGSAGSASAHAMLEATSPGSGAVSAVAPTVVMLHFGEDVGLAPDGVRVLDAHGHNEVAGPAAATGHYVTAPLLPSLATGSYVVLWRAVSADSHPVAGSFAFSVGHPGPLARLHPPAASPWPGALLAVARGAGYLGLAAFAGGVWFGLLCWSGLARSRRGRMLVVAGWATAVLGGAAALLLQGPYARAAGLGRALEPALLRADLDSRYGQAVLVRLLLMGVAGALVGRIRLRASSVLTGLFAVTMLGTFATFAWTGHAGVGDLVPLSVTSDVVHLTAMSLWLGGLLQLSVVVLPTAGSQVARQAATRFSGVAVVSVAALVLTGAFQASRQVGSTGQVWSTSYGRLLLVKSAIVLLVLTAASLSRRWVRLHGDRVVVSAHQDLAVAAAGPRPLDPDAGPLRKAVAVEAALLVGVLAVTSVLVSTAPAHDRQPPSAPPSMGAGR